MELDLTSRSNKWRREQEKQKEKAQRRKALELRQRAAAERAHRQLVQAQTARRIARLQELERLEEQRLEEQRVTGGIKYQEWLRPVPTTGDGDKITLPVSALETLNPQDAFDLGVFTFELSVPKDGEEPTSVYKTHAGVLEFVAEEGTVGLPPKVAASLFIGQRLPEVSDNGNQVHEWKVPEQIHVRFVRLERGTSVSFRPRGDGFGDRALDFKKTLERALRVHTTLSLHDVVLVRQGKQTFELVVEELQPEAAVRILNTDLEVALLPSEAVVWKQQQEQRRQDAERRVKEREQAKEQHKVECMQRLMPEPSVDERMQTKVVLRLPDGQQGTRRFAHTTALQHVFAFVEALTGEDPATYQLVAMYPRRVFGFESAQQTLQALNVSGRQEMFHVEKRVLEASAASNTEDETMDTPLLSGPSLLSGSWLDARTTLETSLDEALLSATATPIHGLEPIMPVVHSNDQAVKWKAQLQELDDMGFTNHDLNVAILERYQGRLLRVVNYLSDLQATTPTEQPMED